MSDLTAWSDLNRQEQDILCQAGLNVGFRTREDRYYDSLYRALEQKGLLQIYNQIKLITTWGLTIKGAMLLAAMPDDLQRKWWPLTSDIAEIKQRLRGASS